jgi:hypothetical protein
VTLIVCVSSGLAEEQDGGTRYCIGHPGSTISWAVYLANYLFAQGPSPEPVAFAGNADCQGGVDLIDVVYLVNFAFRGGPPPCDFCGHYVAPSDTRDAETIAMWYAHEATAPETLYHRIQGDLYRLRTLPGAEHTVVASLPFFPRWIESRISMIVDSMTYAAMQDGLYHAWDSLNLTYEADRIELERPFPSSPFFVTISFRGIKNSVVLAGLYSLLPGVLTAGWDMRIFVGANPPTNLMYPLIRGDTITYLFEMAWDFRGAWGRFHYWYAAALPDTAWIVGEWDPKQDPDTPYWWSEALENGHRYWED